MCLHKWEKLEITTAHPLTAPIEIREKYGFRKLFLAFHCKKCNNATLTGSYETSSGDVEVARIPIDLETFELLKRYPHTIEDSSFLDLHADGITLFIVWLVIAFFLFIFSFALR